uniref:Uncharacterized protein n=1 Tax=Meloidogyne enterolobii TaxID=390850 RepID=A0A6V7XJ92_MELEN|nr:unnamed protein product [Meloidogyne enterolobii]
MVQPHHSIFDLDPLRVGLSVLDRTEPNRTEEPMIFRFGYRFGSGYPKIFRFGYRFGSGYPKIFGSDIGSVPDIRKFSVRISVRFRISENLRFGYRFGSGYPKIFGSDIGSDPDIR